MKGQTMKTLEVIALLRSRGVEIEFTEGAK